MRLSFLVSVLLAGGLGVRTARAQRVIAQDTLSTATPAAISCGFCAGERYGVVFRELAPGGLQPADFPLTIRSLRVAVASARVTGSAPSFRCEGLTAGGSALADLELWAGSEVPSALEGIGPDDPWTPGEELLWAAADVPLMKSTAGADGASELEAGFNELQPVDEMAMPVRVGADARYIRAVVRIREGDAGSSASCAAARQNPPSIFPLRDNDGLIAGERSFIYAGSAGWLWNEDVGIAGDWAIRLEIRSDGAPSSDAGPGAMDGGPLSDGGTADGGVTRDAGVAADGSTIEPSETGCGCQTTPDPAASWPALLALLWLRRRVTGECR